MRVDKIRADFPIFSRLVRGKPIIYFDNAATSQKPTQVIRAMANFYERYCANVHRGVHTLSQEASEMWESAHDKMARFLNARGREEIIFTKNITEALNLVAYSLWMGGHFKRGDEIVLTEFEHHSNLVPWFMIRDRAGVRLRFIATREDGTLDLEDAQEKITHRTRLVSVVHVSNFLGTITPVRELAKLAHERDTLFLVDSAQGVPHLPVDVRRIGCDMLGFTAHKMLGPMGIGGLYVKKDLAEQLCPFLYGGDMISEVSYEGASWNVLPTKFEAGTPPVAEAVGLSAALDYLKEVGMEEVRKHEMTLIETTLRGLRQIPHITIYGPPDARLRGGLVAFNVGDLNPHDVATILDEKENIMVRSGHHCVMPMHRRLGLAGSVRASYHIYNTKEEVAKMLKLIEQIATTLI